MIEEPLGGAHRDVDAAAENVRKVLVDSLHKLSGKSLDKLINARYKRLMAYGQFTER